MKSYKTKGLIYKIKNFQEKDKIVWVLSKEYGKISIMAKGVRNPKSRRGGHIDLFNYVQLTLHKGRNFDNLNEILVIDTYSKTKEENPYLFFYLTELIDKIEIEIIEGKKILTILENILSVCNSSNIYKLISFFEINLLEILGYTPNLKTYIGTDILLSENNIYLSADIPGFIEDSDSAHKVDSNVIKCQRIFITGNLEATLTLKIDLKTQESISRIQKYWIQSIIGKDLKSLELLSNPR